MNKQSMTPHYIAAYTDNDLRKGIKGMAEVDITQKLD
jgi:hypothetical protein